MDIEHGLARFHLYLDQMSQNKQQGETQALNDIAKVKKSVAKAHIVLAICQGLDLHSPEEEITITTIANTLGIQHDIEHILNEMQKHRAA